MSNLNRHRREAERHLRRAEGLKIETTKGLRTFEDFRFAVEQLIKTLDVEQEPTSHVDYAGGLTFFSMESKDSYNNIVSTLLFRDDKTSEYLAKVLFRVRDERAESTSTAHVTADWCREVAVVLNDTATEMDKRNENSFRK